MSSSITIIYELKPPAGAGPYGLNTSKLHDFPVTASPEGGQKAYYTALQKSIAQAKDRIGNELTAWRDAVGKAELTKEPNQTKSEEGEGSDEEAEEEEQ
ncbi:hypothetical protein NP233_g657 [Leucocoprinus birnbaumii]|uniref:EKC/KEOPS complex subunit GON7 n=1 Tax=Leucocoprinus birnbaumii TaxID=56174 RepID=A0AAD5YYI3_9AGAR|nr:hypothetical protein NP233_g657 [Leucocoprinus birnbaumii]